MFNYLKKFISYLLDWLMCIFWFISSFLKSKTQVSIELIALRSQLATFNVKIENNKSTKHQLSKAFKQIWVIISKILNNWQDSLFIVKPETVVKWHKQSS